jgi:pimeloyl-ACP methyl ester carboxylesterase
MTEENITLLQISNTTLNILVYNSTYNITPRVNKNLSESFPICCVFKECSKCCNTFECANEPKTFPIVMVHGHSLRSSYSPDYSLDTFDKIQQRLQGDGYLNAGSLYYAHKTVNMGEWGLSGKPVTIKVTYYYDIYREGDDYIKFPAKSESIDTYALRLNDIIDVVKENTGKPKVNIIAFSMGGLVARKFLQIYGDSSVYKLITISSPHKGIIGKVADLCPVIGESKECNDMQTGSLFLNKLNDPNKQPKNVKIYNILGRGCKTNKQDSDGIILTEHASLKGIVNATEFFVNGTCQLPFTFLHREIINIDEYPEVYEYIVKALRD